MINNENKSISQSPNNGIERYSSHALKRGLKLANKLTKDENINNHTALNNDSGNAKNAEGRWWSCTHSFTHEHKKVTSVSLNAEKQMLAIIDGWGIVNIWDLLNGKLLASPFCCHIKKLPLLENDFKVANCIFELELHHYQSFQEYGNRFTIFIVSNRKILVTIGEEEIKFWNLNNGEFIRCLSRTYNVPSNSENSTIVYEQQEIINVFSINTFDSLISINSNFHNIEEIFPTPDHRFLAASGSTLIGGNWEEDEYINEHCIKIWEVSTGRLIQVINTFIDHENIRSSPSIHLAATGKSLISIDQDKDEDIYFAKVWHIETGKLLYSIDLSDNLILTTIYDQLIVLSEDLNSIRILDINTGTCLNTLSGHSDSITYIKANNEIIASGDYVGIINVWNLKTGELLQTINRHSYPIQLIEIDLNMLATVDSEGVLNVWNLFDLEQNYSQAQEIYEFKFKISETHGRIPPEILFDDGIRELFNDGIREYKQGSYLSAIDNFDKVLDLDPENIYAFVYRGATRAKIGDKNGAADDYSQALSINPNYAEIYNDRGLLRVELGDTQAAIEDYARAIKSDPTFWKPYYNRGKLLDSIDDISGAVDDYSQVLNLNSTISEVYSLRGFAYFKLGNYYDALGDFNKALILDSQAAGLYLNILNESMDKNRIETIVQSLKQALLSSANQYYLQGKYEMALEICNQLIKILPSDSQAYNFRSSIFSALFDYQGALVDLQKAINLSSHKRGNYDFLIYLRLLVEAKKYS